MNSFAQFIEEFTVGDLALQCQIQELFGCILTNNLQYKTCILMEGTGNNGKSLLIKLLTLALIYGYSNNDRFPIFTGEESSGKSNLTTLFKNFGIFITNNLPEITGYDIVNQKLIIRENIEDYIFFPSAIIKQLMSNDTSLYKKDGKMCSIINKAYLIIVSNGDLQLDHILQKRITKIPCLAQPEIDIDLYEKLSDSHIIAEMLDWMKEGDRRVRQQGHLTF